MKVLFLQLVHSEKDDRILHQMQSLRQAGIACTFARERHRDDGADVIICDTPKAVLANRGFSGRVVYDVTEWYPSKKNLRAYPLWLRPLAAVAMAGLSLLAGICADAFLYGEEDKGKPFRKLFGWKPYAYLPYYPSRQLFDAVVDNREPGSPLRVLYAGPLTEEKGYFRAKRVAEACGAELTVIGPDQYMPLEDFCRYIQGFDVALDLRERDVENSRCLPIKLFYYWAAGVVPIYSDLDAIRRHIPDADKAMFLVKTEQEAIDAICTLQKNPLLLKAMSRRGGTLFMSQFNWEMIEDKFKSLIGI